MKKSLFVVIEGVDGAGKTIQIELLKKYFTQKATPFEAISFPRYEDNLYGKLIKRYLEGEFGSINNVNPYLMACVYAGDRALAKKQIENWFRDGKLVIANRYVSSSKAHMGANLLDDKGEEFFKWLDKLEYEINEIPKEDLTILLNIDPKVGQKNVAGEHKPDIHENDLNHLNKANEIYLELSKKEPNWVVLDCMKGNQMRNKEDIHKEIIRTLPNF